jgi:hypothetical protein
MGAHVSRERRLEIFKDSRVGTYGALAAVFMVLFPYAVLAPLDGGEFVRAALAGHVLGRWSTLPQSLLLPPAAGQGSGGLVRASAPVVLGGTVVAVGVALLAGGLVAGAIAVATALVLTGLGGTYFRARLGGVTGDTFGAGEQGRRARDVRGARRGLGELGRGRSGGGRRRAREPARGARTAASAAMARHEQRRLCSAWRSCCRPRGQEGQGHGEGVDDVRRRGERPDGGCAPRSAGHSPDRRPRDGHRPSPPPGPRRP